MSFELSLAWKYFYSRRHHPFIHVIRRVSVAGVALGVTALIVVLGVMNGFERDLKERIIGTHAHAVVNAPAPFEFTGELRRAIQESSEEITALSPFVQGQVLIEKDKTIEGVLFRGALEQSETRVTAVGRYVQKGRYPAPDTNEVLVGKMLARRLDLSLKDEIRLISPVTRKPVTAVVSGFFESGMYEYDAHLVYASLDFAQSLYGMPDLINGVAVRYQNPGTALEHRTALREALGFPFRVSTWMDMNRNLFGALKLERIVMFIILTLIVMVACFNIIDTLTLLVIDKTRDIGILKSLGASPGQIMSIFTWNGFFIGSMGTVCGLALGIAICLFLDQYPLIHLPSDIYYFDRLPVHIQWTQVGIIAAASLILSLVSTFYPARSAAILRPVEAIRYRG